MMEVALRSLMFSTDMAWSAVRPDGTPVGEIDDPGPPRHTSHPSHPLKGVVT
jgi:hypothetical protein